MALTNVEKQARFAAKHPGYHKRYPQKSKPRPWTPLKGLHVSELLAYCVFTLGDPRDPYHTPHVIAHGLSAGEPVWGALWRVRNLSRSRWALWLRELSNAGLEPVVYPTLSLGLASPIDWRTAHKIAAHEIRRLAKLSTGDPKIMPSS